MVARSRWPVAALLTLGIMVPADGVPGQTLELERDRAKGGVVMLQTQLPGGSAFGAGVILGADRQRVYIVTANHLIRNRGIATSIKVQFLRLPGEWLDAQPLDLFDPGLDLGAVVVSAPPTLSPAALKAVAAPSALLRRGDDVYPLGFPQSRAWNMPVAADKIVSASTLRVVFQSPYVIPGYSGGALLNSCGRVVGIVTSSNPPEAEAVPIESVLDLARRWSLPITPTMTMSSSACGDETAIEEVLSRYKHAYEQRSVDELKKIWPSLTRQDEQAMRRAFAQYIAQNVEFRNCRTISSDVARVTHICDEVITMEIRRAGKQQRQSIVTFVFRTQGTALVIESITRSRGAA